MKKILLGLFSFFAHFVSAQINITNIIFYDAGDTIVQNIDNDATHAFITPASNVAQTWNFSQLKADSKSRDTIKGISSSDTILKYFPTAVLKQPFQTLGTEYIEIISTEVRGLGISANFFGLNFIQPYNGKRTIQFAPITLNTKKSSTSSVNFGLSVAAIPFLDTLIKNFVPIPGATIDSIRISLVTKADFIADAYGKLTTPYETIDVLRVKQENKTSTKIEAKAKILLFSIWQDISGLLPIPLPRDTTYTYLFYSNKVKDPIVTINADKAGKTTRTLFRASPAVPKDTTKSVIQVPLDRPIISIAYADGNCQIRVSSAWAEADLELYQMDGKKIASFNRLSPSTVSSEVALPRQQPLIAYLKKGNQLFRQQLMIE